MTDTATARYGARQQSQGSNTNTWGDDKLNEVLRLMDRGSKGVQSIAMTGDQTLSWTSYVATNTGQCAVLLLTGSLSAVAALVAPSVEWQWDVIKNSTGQTITVRTAAGSGVAIANGKYMSVYCDGADCYNGSPTVLPGAVTVSGALTVAGQISGVVAGTASTDATNVAQVALAISAAGTLTPATARISINDTTANYLAFKVTAGNGLDADVLNSGGNEQLQLTVNTTELPEFLALSGQFTSLITSGTVAMVDRRRYRISGGTGTLPTFVNGSFVIVEYIPAGGVTATIARNGQTIDGASADDTYIGSGGTGPVVLYTFSAAGAVVSRLIGGVPF